MLFEFDNGANEFAIEDIEAFLKGDKADTPPAENPETPPAAQPGDDAAKQQKTIETTKAFAHRLKEEKEKARNEAFDTIAKENGFENYAAMKAANEAKLLKEKGLDPEEVTPIVEELLKKRLADDPRLKELDAFKQQKIQDWAQQELTELNALTGGKISKIEDVPKNVIERWKTKGSLKAAYLELEGEKLIKEMQSGQNRSTTGHLNSPSGVPVAPNAADKRPFTQKEKDIYKMFNPSVTDEELNKMLKDKQEVQNGTIQNRIFTGSRSV